MKINKKIVAGLILLTALCLGLFYSQGFALVSGQLLKIERVATAEEQRMGLSGRKSLCESCGMLFSYNEPQEIGIWMKDMNFSIDIVWLDASKRVSHVEHSVTPETYPESFSDTSARSQYVIELPAGYVKDKNIKQGDQFYFW